MAINPFRIGELQIPTNPQQRPIDFSGLQTGLSELGAGIGRYRDQQEVGEIMAGAVDPATGELDWNKAAKALAVSGRDPTKVLSQLTAREGLARQEAAQRSTEAYQTGMLDLKRQEVEQGKLPAGFRRTETGHEFIPGGIADPTYIAKLAELKQKPREFSVSDIGKLSEEGGKFSQVAGFGATFEPRFAGYTVPGVGGVAMTAGRYLPKGVVGEDVSEAASWWQGYSKYRNVIRNELYGSALTAHEQKAFAEADIDPSMTPDQIKKNLAVQRQVVGSGLKRKANALIASGYDPAVIAKTYGLDLSELGVDASGRRGTVTPASAGAGPAAPAPTTMPAPGTVSRGYRFKGGDPSKQENWEAVR